MGLIWIENMRRRERAERAARLGLQPREDLLRRPDEAASRETSAVGRDAASGAAGTPSFGEPERADVSPEAAE